MVAAIVESYVNDILYYSKTGKFSKFALHAFILSLNFNDKMFNDTIKTGGKRKRYMHSCTHS